MNKYEKKLDSLKMFRELVKTSVKPLADKDFMTGRMVTFSYNAKDKTKAWDNTPLVIVLRRSKGYTLGLNFHWVPTKIRYVLLEYILKRNKSAITNNEPLRVSYDMVKDLIIKLKLRAVVRLYINKRISKRGVVIPYELMRKAIELPAENFIGISAEQAYSLMVRKSNSNNKKPKSTPKPQHKNRKQQKQEKDKKKG